MGFEDILGGFNVPLAGMAAERFRMEVIAQNIANAGTTRTSEGGPYVRRTVRFETVLDRLQDRNGGLSRAASAPPVRVAAVRRDETTPFTVVHDPGHPDADGEGNVRYPNVSLVHEMVDFNVARRSYEANLAVFRALRNMMRNAVANMSR